MKIFSPVGERKSVLYKDQLAPRQADLKGKTIGFLDNRAGKVYFERIEELFKDRAKVGRIKRWVKPEQTSPASADLIDEVAHGCDAVVVGVGV